MKHRYIESLDLSDAAPQVALEVRFSSCVRGGGGGEDDLLRALSHSIRGTSGLQRLLVRCVGGGHMVARTLAVIAFKRHSRGRGNQAEALGAWPFLLHA